MSRPIMRRGMLTLATMLLWGLADRPAPAQAPPTDDDLLIVPAELDLGRHEPGTVVRRSAWIVNAGRDAIELTAVRPSCGCTTLRFEPAPLAGQTALELPLTVIAPLQPGRSRRVSVTVTAKDRPPVRLPVWIRSTGEPPAAVVADPPEVDLGPVMTGTTRAASLRLLNRGEAPQQVTAARTSCPCTRIVDFAPVTLAPGEDARFTVQIDAPATIGRPVSRDVTFVVPGQGAVTVPLRLEPDHAALKSIRDHLRRTLAAGLQFDDFRIDDSTVTGVVWSGDSPTPFGRVTCQLDDAGNVITLRIDRIRFPERLGSP